MQREEAELVRDLTALRSARAAILQAIELLESRERLPLESNDGTMMPMMARETGGDSWSSVPGRAPSGDDAVSKAARSMGIGIRAIARKLKISEGTLLKQVARNRVPQDVADAARKLAAEFAAKKK